MSASRAVGIDLGTTHTVVAWADLTASGEVRVFDVPQLVAPTEIEKRPLYPSALYAPLEGELQGDPFGDAPFVTGELARKRGAEVPGRLIASAKSWLCHAAVDRQAAILPWGLKDEDASFRISPVEASARLLAHVRRTWNEAFPDAPLEEQEVVLTVPASFDEVARELTLDAATRAGLAVRLLEEPQAAFYDYMQHAGALDALVEAGSGAPALVLVCDVGGGTTDLSLIEVRREAGGALDVARVAVGDHLLLGGDNMDLALAHVAESRLGQKLDSARFAQLVAACRTAKERLLSGAEEARVAVLGRGSSLVGSTLATTLTRADADAVVVEGFFPFVTHGERARRARGGLVAFGLPYEREAAITRHVADFLARYAAGKSPTALLLNGGVFRAPDLTTRLVTALAKLAEGGRAPTLLPHADPDLAVARGAVTHALARRGVGRRIEGGTPRGYYVGLDDKEGKRRAVCVVPKGAREGEPHRTTGRTFALTLGRAVRFDLYASDGEGHAGDVVLVDEAELTAMPPLAVLFGGASLAPPSARARFAPRGAMTLDVLLEGELTPLGTLDLACVEASPAEGTPARRFRLAFQLRESEGGEAKVATTASAPPQGKRSTRPPPSSHVWDEARAAIDRAFGKTGGDASVRAAKDLVRELERLLGDRSAWSVDVARAVFDALAPGFGARRRSAEHERVFWQLAGFTVRPGFGYVGDDERTKLLGRLLPDRLAFPDEARGWQQFFIALRRVAGGLDEATQTGLRDAFDPVLAPKEAGLKKPKKGTRVLAAEDLLDAMASLERVAPRRRSDLGEWVLERTWTSRDPRLWGAIGRLGARVPAYASVHHVVAPEIAERWLEQLLRDKWDDLPTAIGAAVELARVTGDRARDIDDAVRASVVRKLESARARPEQVRAVREHVAVEQAERATFFGEGLPAGLALRD